MSTDYNRIKVADLETNEPNKVLKTNENGELQFSEVSLDNDLFFESGLEADSIVLKNKNNNTSTGIGAVVLGQNSEASGVHASAIGLNTTASGYWSHAQGNNTVASNFGSHAQGVSTISSGYASHAQGEETVASGDHSFAGGYSSTASGESSLAFGFNAMANATGTIVLGSNITGNQPNTTYVDNLNIKTLSSGTSIMNLGLDSNGNVTSHPRQNLQSILDTGSGATTNNELTIWTPNFRFFNSQSKGAILTDGQGIKIQGQNGGIYLEGHSGGLHLGNTSIIDFSAPAEFLAEAWLKSPTRVKNGNVLIFEGSGNNGVINKGQYPGDPLLINCDDGILVNNKYIATAVNGVTADRSGMIVTMAVNNTTTPLSLSDLNSTYPNVLPDYRVQ